jgi:23S rRNA pseudouridine1911/1915/1917 synthase
VPIVFEDARLLVVSKPPGVSVYPSRRHRTGSLLERVHRQQRAAGGGAPPSPCHRLDRETSGLFLLAKDVEARAAIGRQFEERSVRKTYLAWVRGVPPQDEGRIDRPLGPDATSRIELKRGVCADGRGQRAVTGWRVRERRADCALLELSPETGRQHQLRAHLAAIGHPILGDKLYLGGDDLFLASLERDLRADERAELGADRLCLHAWRLALRHPERARPMTLQAPAGPDLEPSG